MQRYENSVLYQGQQCLRVAPGAEVYVYTAGTLTLAAIYETNDHAPLINPTKADDQGTFFFYAEDGTYDIRVVSPGRPEQWSKDVLFQDLLGEGGLVHQDDIQVKPGLIEADPAWADIQSVGQPDGAGPLNVQAMALAARTTDNRRRLDSIGSAETGAGAVLVGYRAPQAGAVGRTALDKLNDILSVRDFIDSAIDGVADNQAGIVAAVAAAKAQSAALDWPAGTYVSSGNIPGFHDVVHSGVGVIKRGSSTWNITPTGVQLNELHVADGGVSTNDGFSDAAPLSMSRAGDVIQKVGEKAGAGQWRIRIHGVITFQGLTLDDWPYFTNPLQIWGEDVGVGVTPTSVWDGASVTAPYALRADAISSLLNLDIRNLKFSNWARVTNPNNCGAVLMWNRGTYVLDNVHTENCPIGSSFRQCRLEMTNCRFDGCITYGTSVVYHSWANIGTISGSGNQFINCDIGVRVSRLSIGYIESNTFDGCRVNIEYSRMSRIVPRNNTHSNWTWCVYFTDFIGIQHSGGSSPDTFLTTPTKDTPVVIHKNLAVHEDIHRGPVRTRHLMSDGGVANISDAIGVQTLLQTVNSTMIPFRFPSYTLWGTQWRIGVELYLGLNANAAGELALHGASNAASAKAASITIAPVASARTGKFIFELESIDATATPACRWRVFCHELGLFATGTTANMGSAPFMGSSESEVVWRLYWTPTDNAQVSFYCLSSYVEL